MISTKFIKKYNDVISEAINDMAHNTLGLDLFLVGAGAIVFAAYLLYGHWLIVKNQR